MANFDRILGILVRMIFLKQVTGEYNRTLKPPSKLPKIHFPLFKISD